MTYEKPTAKERWAGYRVRKLFEEISEEHGEDLARGIFAAMGKRPRGRPKGNLTILNRPPSANKDTEHKRKRNPVYRELRRLLRVRSSEVERPRGK
jgi:hypothetical protein